GEMKNQSSWALPMSIVHSLALSGRTARGDSRVPVINPQQRSGDDADAGDDPPHACGLVRDFSEMVDERSAEPAADQRTDSDRQERESHIRALLPGRREPRDVFVVARLLDDFAQSENEQRQHRPPDGWPEG